MTAPDCSNALRGFTNLLELRFGLGPGGEYTLILNLTRDARATGEIIAFECSQVSNLTLKDFGGGITQLLYLQIEDIRSHQLDRVNFRISELERELIAFDCAHIRVNPLNPDRAD